MEVVIEPDADAVGKRAASAVVNLLARKPNAVLGLATGSSPLPVYKELIRQVERGQLSFGGVRCFLLDEYVGLSSDHPDSYLSFIRREFARPVGLAPEQVHGLDGSATDLLAEPDRYERAIRDAGGIDLQILGIGSDGHIGFNEPISSLGSRTRLKTLTRSSRADNARFFGGDVDAVPRHVLTQGIGTILEARHVVLVAMGQSKARPVRKMIEEPVAAMFPASALQFHPHVSVVLDELAAKGLANASYYRETFANKPDYQAL